MAKYELVAIKREWVPEWLWGAMSFHSPWTLYGLLRPPSWFWLRPILTRRPPPATHPLPPSSLLGGVVLERADENEPGGG